MPRLVWSVSSRRRWSPWSDRPPQLVAALGAGEGTLSQLLAKRAKKVIAINNSEKMVEFGAALAKKHGFKNLEFRHGDLEAPPSPQAPSIWGSSARPCTTPPTRPAPSPQPIAF